MSGQQGTPAALDPEGIWWYNDFNSCYEIVNTGDGLVFNQALPNGAELHGKFMVNPRLASWSWEARLSNFASIRFRLSGSQLVSTYRRAGSSEWRPEVVAVRQPWAEAAPEQISEQAPAARDLGLNQHPAQASNAPVSRDFRWHEGHAGGSSGPATLASQIRCTLMNLGMGDEVCARLPSSASCAAATRASLLAAAVEVGAAPASPFSRHTAMPLARYIKEDAFKKARGDQRRQRDAKQTIAPLPLIKVVSGLKHPLSFNENQMFRLWVADPHSMAYTLGDVQPSAVRLSPAQCVQAFKLIASRHDAIRCSFRLGDGSEPFRVVQREFPGQVHTMVASQAADFGPLIYADMAAPHALGMSSARFSSLLSPDGAPLFGINFHHILGDADAMGTFWREFLQIEVGLSLGYSVEELRCRLPPIPVQYTDFAYWQVSLSNQGLLEPDIAFWYAGIASSCPPVVLDVPLDLPRPRSWTVVGASERCRLSSELFSIVQEAVPGATPFAIIFAQFAIILSRFSMDRRINLATPFALRTISSLQPVIGNFVNMLVVAGQHDPSETFAETVQRYAISAANIQRYSLAPFLSLVNETRRHYPTNDPSRNDIYASMVDVVPNPNEDSSGSMLGILDVFLLANTRDGLIWSGDCVYNTTILDQQKVRLMLLHLQALCWQAARSINEPVPAALPGREEVHVSDSSGHIPLASVLTRLHPLPQVITVASGWEMEGPADYLGIRRHRRVKAHSGLEVWADSLGGAPTLKPLLEVPAPSLPAPPVLLLKAASPPQPAPVSEERAKTRRAEVARRCALVAQRDEASRREQPAARSRLIRF